MHKTFLLTLPNAIKSANRADSAVANVELVGHYALRQAWDACAVCLLFLVTFHPVFKFTELHALTLATRSYALLVPDMNSHLVACSTDFV